MKPVKLESLQQENLKRLGTRNNIFSAVEILHFKGIINHFESGLIKVTFSRNGYEHD